MSNSRELKTFKELKECLACGGRDLFNFINFGENHPLANTYPKVPKYDLPTYPLKVNICKDCTHTQLTIAVDPDLLFKDYLYVSGTTQTLQRHFESFVSTALARSQGTRVLDIGCNDGSLLAEFARQGAVIDGVDPAENLAAARKEKLGVETITGYWSKDLAKSMGQFHIITGLNVFAHNSDPLGFLEACKECLSRQGEVIIEFPYYKNVYLEAQDGQIYHEHVSGFTVRSFAALATRAGFGIVEIIESKVHGGSIRFFLQIGQEHCKKVGVYIAEESRLGLDKLETYRKFAEQVQNNYKNLLLAAGAQRALGYKVIGYGAAAKASTTLNALEGNLELDMILDDAPLKQDRWMPGVNIPIKPTSVLSEESGRLCVVIFPFNFKDEIISRIRKARPEGKDIAILYVPKVSVEDIQ